jgi:hypothetical protein
LNIKERTSGSDVQKGVGFFENWKTMDYRGEGGRKSNILLDVILYGQPLPSFHNLLFQMYFTEYG